MDGDPLSAPGPSAAPGPALGGLSLPERLFIGNLLLLVPMAGWLWWTSPQEPGEALAWARSPLTIGCMGGLHLLGPLAVALLIWATLARLHRGAPER